MGRDQKSKRSVVRAGVSATLRDYLQRYPDIQLDRLTRSAGLDPTQLGNPDAFFDQQHWFLLVEAAARETGDGYLAIGFVEQMPWKDFGVLGYVARNSATVGDALVNMARYFAVQQTGGQLALEPGWREVTYQYTVEDPRIVEHGQITEGLFALIVRLIRESLGEAAWKPRAIAFRHDGPTDLQRHARYFGSEPRYRQRANKLTLATADLERRFVSADLGLLPHLVAHATASIAAMPKSGDDVHRAVIAALGAGDPTIERVASTLGQSARRLQRKLKAEDRSFKEVVDDTRLDLAKRYLADAALSLTETAFLLGYSDLSAFSRAFRRWTDVSPLEFRSRANERASRTAPNAGSSPRPTRTR